MTLRPDPGRTAPAGGRPPDGRTAPETTSLCVQIERLCCRVPTAPSVRTVAAAQIRPCAPQAAAPPAADGRAVGRWAVAVHLRGGRAASRSREERTAPRVPTACIGPAGQNRPNRTATGGWAAPRRKGANRGHRPHIMTLFLWAARGAWQGGPSIKTPLAPHRRLAAPTPPKNFLNPDKHLTGDPRFRTALPTDPPYRGAPSV